MADEVPGTLDPDEETVWRSLRVLTTLGLPALERTFKEYGLVQIEYGLLASLVESPQGVRLTDLAEAMNVSQSRLSHRMGKLLRRGLVEVRSCPGDGRVTIAVATDEGLALVEEITPRHARDLRSMIFDRLTEAQVGALAEALHEVAAGLCPRNGR
ncbi:MarR family winged helix-turn-helix transcriptional regulator [Actinocorallia longicatena]|uniref:MarR family transcriptional regulator n=1 Tax=Actinocorallia longicatena TaxID=111803 RepID=A0ABP6QFW0_9ACTN